MSIDKQIKQAEESIYAIGLELRNAWSLPHREAAALRDSCEKRTRDLKQHIRKLRAQREKDERESA